MPHYKFTYFAVRGLGEVSRMILHYAKVPFDDVRVQKEEWEKIKPTTKFGQLPVLEVDGVQIAQSYAIARYLARQYKLAGKDDLEAAKIDSVADLQKDMGSPLGPYFAVASGRAEGDKEALKASLLVPTLEKFLPMFEKLLKESGSGFFAKSGVSWVDFAVAESISTFQNMAPEVIKKHSALVEHVKRVHALPQLKDYLAKRPVTPF